MTTVAPTKPATPRKRWHFQETGLLLVILLLGFFLSIFGGNVKTPVFTTNADGQREAVFKVNAQGEQEPVTMEKNKFLNAQNLAQLAKDTSFIGIMAVGATFVIVSGGIDLSVGAIYAMASVLAALVFHRFGPEGSSTQTTFFKAILPGTLLCLGTGAFSGLINGGMITALRVHPFIITLGTMAIFRGVAFVITEGQSVGSFPTAFTSLVRHETGDGLFLVPVGVMVLIGFVGWLALSRLAIGRRVYAIGGNETASRFSGVSVNRVKLGVYLISGLCAGISALLSLGYYGGATSGDGQGYELNVIAAAVVGGASLSGGKGSAYGAILGALIIQMITSGVIILKIDQNYSQIIIGSVVVLAVVLDQINGYFERRSTIKAASIRGAVNT
jgi:ribose transport system permease protein